MKKIKQILLAVIMICFLGQSSYSAGFPTHDALVFFQLTLEYQRILDQLEELYHQTDQFEREYLQMMAEFNLYLEQLKGIKHLFEERDWNALTKIIVNYYGKHETSLIPVLNPEDATFETDLQAILEEFGNVPRDPSDIHTDASALSIWSSLYEDQAKKDFNHFNRLKDRMAQVAQNQKNSEERKQWIGRHAEMLRNLDDNSDLRTMQQIACELITIMKQNEELIQVMNQALLNDGWQDADTYSEHAKQRESEIHRLKSRTSTEGFGASTFGGF